MLLILLWINIKIIHCKKNEWYEWRGKISMDGLNNIYSPNLDIDVVSLNLN
ncbi:hypothetical protein LCR01_00640 [Companilactobacillus crustorum]|uniref:Uncharacterized protein n=1 Tax=Companilactobacillus crustorum TaxID=392416 RepID=A0AB34A6X7_9LACO|nr:hypothetical protein LCR01_00640 [Companilactobacillus crustorum]